MVKEIDAEEIMELIEGASSLASMASATKSALTSASTSALTGSSSLDLLEIWF